MLFEYKRERLKFDGEESKSAFPDMQSSPVNLGDILMRKYFAGWVKLQVQKDFQEAKAKLGALFSPELFQKRISNKHPLLVSIDVPADVPQNILVYEKEY